MSKVEELRAYVIAHCLTIDPHEAVDSLIAAANEEGCDDGWAASKMLWTRMQEWNKEWQKENPKERSLTLLDAMDLIVWKLAKARAEGAEQEREKIREQGEFILKQDAPFASDVDLYIIPASLLAPATEVKP